MEGDTGDMVVDLHQDLARKYRTHGPRIEEIWRSFDKAQRTKCLKSGAAEGVVLKHPLDTSLGVVYKVVPEWNSRDITEPGSDFLLRQLKHRATKSLFDQYAAGPDGGPGDHAFIDEMVRTKGLRHVNSYKNCWTFFMDDNYGKSFQVHDKRAMAGFTPAIQAGLCIPQSTGEFVLQRQINLLQALNIMVEDILEMGSKTRNQNQRPKKSEKPPTAAFSSLSLQPAPAKISLTELAATAHDQGESFQEHVELLSEEPTVLAHDVNITFFSRPELVPDEKGRMLPVHTDKYISAAFFEAVHGEIQGAAIWAYISRLVDLLASSTPDKMHRALILQELSNICHLEYTRAQTAFKRHVATSTGSKRFKRISNVYDGVGNARVSIKGSPEELTRTDPQLHYLLRLCQPETTAPKAIDWMKKLGDLYVAYPLERERLEEREADAICDLAAIIGFIGDLSSAVSLPTPSRKKGQAFMSRAQELDVELAQLKKEIDLRDFVAPIDNLLEPGMARGALNKLEEFVVEKTGTKLGFLYQDLVEECMSDLQTQYEQAKARTEKDANSAPPPPLFTPQPQEERVESRRQKEKTRPSHSSAYELTPHADADASPAEEPAAPTQAFKVSPSAAGVFSNLLQKSQSRASVGWTAFEAAMTELGFSVLPKFGSVYTFYPPEGFAVNKSVTVHRPHKSQIEGFRILILARRLKRVYGWNERTFEVV
ncbi:hypothetical protein FZEAL_8259 [Fusarium zealandicum]|uniref:Ipa protein n=1 Tax=Fusarium zealandicum TaxID=1053134 RepID=A0A8H4UEU9_9HYPO|nr:hypothetical protein FZEAL_8259 [Fusarium zealandicum]